VAARSIGLLLALLMLSACGTSKPHPSTERAAVSAYIAKVNAIETQMTGPLHSIATATTAFAHGRPAGETATAFAAAQVALVNLYSRLIFLKPPPPAKKLHALVLRLVGRQADLAGELHRLVTFNAAFVQALRPLVAANAAARKALRTTKKRARVAEAVHAFRLAVDGVSARLRALRPPPVERPLFDAQSARLAGLGTSLAGLERAIRADDPTAIARFQHAVSVASVSSDARANQVAERQAVVSYDARVASVRTLARQVVQERSRLQQTVR
jgi:hypothetical protein